ncbi:hypothetical protein E1301_Tti010029 [Triplophysa tibetana]|uniref:Uncharacterized protein n=1 Tax=Triplophysa tibetana TaxID=1572043 RepID=A0A5A9NVN3_9TELE|nr:hypothetical protein E1301_Tti010029 [Triplophysa tibetana]
MHDGHMLIHGYTAEHPTSCLERTARANREGHRHAVRLVPVTPVTPRYRMTRGLSSTSNPRQMTAPRGPVQTPDPSPLSPGACQWGPLLSDSAVTRPLKALPPCSVSPALRPAFDMTCLGVIV